MVFLSEYIPNIFPVKSTKVRRKQAGALRSKILAFGLQTDRYFPSAFYFKTLYGLYSVELGFLKKIPYGITS